MELKSILIPKKYYMYTIKEKKFFWTKLISSATDKPRESKNIIKKEKKIKD